MAAAIIKFPVVNIEDVLKAGYDRLKVYRAPYDAILDGPGTPVELTNATTRLTLEPDITSYEFVDPSGSVTDFYASAFYNTKSGDESDPSDYIQSNADSSFDVLSVQELKDHYLFGVDLSDTRGCPFPDSMFEHYIKSAVAWVERRLDICLKRCIFTDSDAERLDFYRQDYYKYLRLQTNEFPIISVEAVKLVLPTEQEVIDFDPSWFQIDKPSGQLEIIPGRGQLSVITLGQTGAWLPLIYGWTDFIPHVFRVSYTAGFEPPIPSELVDLVGKVAAMGPLNVAGDLVVGAGIASQSMALDGISTAVSTTQSATASGYSARILEYRREIKETLAFLRNYYKGIRWVAA